MSRSVMRLGLLVFLAGAMTFFFIQNRDRPGQPYPEGRVQVSEMGGAFQVIDTREPVMGTTFSIEVAAADEQTGRTACLLAYRRIRRVEQSMSSWLPDSIISHLNRQAGGEAVILDADTLTVLQHARNYWEFSGKAFDPTVGPLIDLWKPLSTLEKEPEPAAIEAALRCVGFQHLVIDADLPSARLDRPGMKVNLGGIAKGYGADVGARAALEAGAVACRVNAGGDLLALGAPPWSPEGFPVEVRDPNGSHLEVLPALEFHALGVGVATSGNYERVTVIDGKRYSHIIDPSTGRPVEDAVIQVTVIGSSGTEADALATALTVLGVEKGMELAEVLPLVEALFIYRDGEEVREARSSGFPHGAE